LLVIQIINRLSKKVQNFVYGRNVTTPSLNIMIAFVGGGQVTLPGRSFARFLLILFIFFSLIIRTCHQSKYLEYLQGDFVKSEIQSIDEIIERNLSVYVQEGFINDVPAFDGFKKFIEYETNDFLEVFEKTLDPDFQGVVLTTDFFRAVVEFHARIDEAPLKHLKDPIVGTFFRFPHKPESFLKEQINEMINRLHSAGLIILWYDRKFGIKIKPEKESEPKPLTMSHLTVGFIVSLLMIIVETAI